MDKLKQEAIKSHYAKLVECMDPLRVMDHLAKLLSLEDMELIRKSQFISQERTRELITIILRKNEELRPFELLIKALEETDINHETMANTILNTYKHDNGATLFEKVSKTLLSDTGEMKYALQTVQQSLKEMYLTRFQEVRPFSLPFTFNIENTWVSLALKEENKDSQATEDHAELLKRAFQQVKMLIIEGDPATGKTSLMRRLAYEWANEKQQLLHYDLLLYAEFREVREKTFKNIADLVLHYSKQYLHPAGYGNLENLVNNEKFCKACRILVLLDGYDESSLDKQCLELSSYIIEKMINKALLFNTLLTTRKGYLSTYRGVKGRLVFAEVLGFKTMAQKEKYIFKHFLSLEIDNKENIEAVHHLLAKNENLNKLAETPLFLTFICLVHEKIVDGTLLELYCNIIRWLIDRHQQDFPDRDVPALFEFQSVFEQASEPLYLRQKQNIIQNNYLEFPQLISLGKMALNKLEKNIFQESDFPAFNIKSIIHQVGLIRKDEFYDQSWNLKTTYSFPHRTIQEFLAALYCFCSNDPSNECLSPTSELDTTVRGMNEFERFLLRIALSDKMPIRTEKRKYYMEKFVDIYLNISFDAFNTTAGFNNKLLNWFLSQCTNVQKMALRGKLSDAKHARNKLNNTSSHNRTAVTSNISSPTLFSFCDLIKLQSLTLWYCKFEADSQLSIKNSPSLRNLIFNKCEIESGTSLGIATLPAISIVEFWNCTFKVDSQLAITNCPSLKKLKFNKCEIESSTNLGIATFPAIDTVEFSLCNIDLVAWQSITDQIRNSSVNYLKLTFGADFNMEYLIHLQNYGNVKKLEITIERYKIHQNDVLSFNDLIKLHSVIFNICTFEANSQLSITNCPLLINLGFSYCRLESSTIISIATLPAVDTVLFSHCNLDLATWQSITDQFKNSAVTCLKLSADYFIEETYPDFLYHLQKCERIQLIHVMDYLDSNDNILNLYEDKVAANLAQTAQKLPGLKSITISDENGERLNENRKLKEGNREHIEKAGQERYPDFSIKYMEEDLS